MLYRLKTGVHNRIEGKRNDGTPIRKKYHPSQLIDLSREEAEKLGDRVVPHVPHVDDEVDDLEVLAAAAAAATAAPAEPDVEAPPDAPDPTEVWAFIAEKTVPEVEELVADMDSDADLRAIYAVEKAGATRVGVFNAVRFRLADLSDKADAEADADDDAEAADEADAEADAEAADDDGEGDGDDAEE